MSKPRTAFAYECHYCVAEFGEEIVTVEANSREEADRLIDKWCKENFCVSSTSPGCPKPIFKYQGFLFKG